VCPPGWALCFLLHPLVGTLLPQRETTARLLDLARATCVVRRTVLMSNTLWQTMQVAPQRVQQAGYKTAGSTDHQEQSRVDQPSLGEDAEAPLEFTYG